MQQLAPTKARHFGTHYGFEAETPSRGARPQRAIMLPSAARMLRSGSCPWVFKQLVASVDPTAEEGDVVELVDNQGAWLGMGFYSKASNLSIRFIPGMKRGDVLDAEFFRDRLTKAFTARQPYYAQDTHYRLFYSESDGIPGLVIDRYCQYISVQSHCAGIDRVRDVLFDTLQQLFNPTAILERSEGSFRDSAGLEPSVGVVRGEYTAPAIVDEGGVLFQVDVTHGHKTGWYLDHREHREVVRKFAKGRSVLDMFCAEGAFGIHCAVHGATHVSFLDNQLAPLQKTTVHAKLNGVEDKVTSLFANALDWIGTGEEQYDMVILDPPNFNGKGQGKEAGREGTVAAYQRINAEALKLLPKGGILATGCSSSAIDEADFLNIIKYSADMAGCEVHMLHRGGLPPDHPVSLAMKHTAYLKFFVFQRCL